MFSKYSTDLPFRVFSSQAIRRTPTFPRRFSTASPSFPLSLFSCVKRPVRVLILTFLHALLIFFLLLFLFLISRRHSVFDVVHDWPEAWGSCFNPAFHYWVRGFLQPKRVETCSNLVLLASQRGKAAQKRGLAIANGLKAPSPLDGCSMAHGGKGGSFSKAALAALQGEPSTVSRWRWSTKEDRNKAPASMASCQFEWVTYSTECSVNLNRMADIADMMGISLLVVGLHEVWMGWGGRTRMVRDVIMSLPADRLVLASDADDVIILPTKACSAPNILARFRSVESPVLAAGERFCYPDGHRWVEYPTPPGDTPYRYLNGGTFVGYAWALADVIGQAYRGDCIDDQREFTRVFLANVSYVGKPDLQGERKVASREKRGDAHLTQRQNGEIQLEEVHPYMKLDWFNELVIPLGGSEFSEFDFSGYKINGTVRSRLTDGHPCIFHQNGIKFEDLHHPVVWSHLLEAIQIDRLREEQGYLVNKKGL